MCVAPECGPRDKITPSGDCVTCDEYEAVSDDLKSCVDPQCRENDFITPEGDCVPCDRFTVVTSDKKSCIKPDCVAREFITKDGTCEACLPYTKPTEDKMSCHTAQCDDERDSIGPDGECHEYDDTLEKRFEALSEQASACASNVEQLNRKVELLELQL